MNSVNAYNSETQTLSHRVNRNSISKNSEMKSHISRGASSIESDTIITRVSRENSAVSQGI